jgi:predicted DNA-binding antitoxin AbrB/MazE fold protein
MSLTVEAIYEDGVLKPAGPLPLRDKERVQITVHTRPEVQAALNAVQRGYGLDRWTGDVETLDHIALDDEFGILESR